MPWVQDPPAAWRYLATEGCKEPPVGPTSLQREQPEAERTTETSVPAPTWEKNLEPIGPAILGGGGGSKRTEAVGHGGGGWQANTPCSV